VFDTHAMDLTQVRGFKVVVSTVVFERGALLMVRHGRDPNPGRWNLPGGKLRPGENLIDAAARETREETGFEVEPHTLAGVYSYLSRKNRHTLRLVFHADLLDGDVAIDGDEITDVRFFRLGQIDDLPDEALCRPALLREVVRDLRTPANPSLGLLCELAEAA